MNRSSLIILALVLVIAALLLRSGCQGDETRRLKDQLNLEQAKNDTLRREPDGSVSKQVFAAEDIDMLRKSLVEKDADLAKMLKAGNKVGLKTRTEVRIDTVVETINERDTILGDIRHATIQTKDYTANIISAPDSTRMSLTAIDTVRYSIGSDYRLRASHSWKDLQVVELESFYVKPPAAPKRNWKFWVGAIAGGALVYGAMR